MLAKIKRLGAALFVAAVTGAGTAGPAAAITHHFEAESSPYILTGQALASPTTFTFGSGAEMSCEATTLYGTQTGTLTQGITVSPTYQFCTLSSLAATIDSPCSFNFTGETDAFGHVPVHFECPSKMQITITGCTIIIQSQTMAQGAHFTKSGTGSSRDLKADVTMKNGVYEKLGPFCGIVGGMGNDLSITGSYTLRAYQDKENVEGSQIGFTLRETT
jgi:hypothetical protein